VGAVEQIDVDGAPCARRGDGSLVCWGPFYPSTVASAPATVAGLPPILDFATSRNARCAAGTAGSAWCWGRGTFGALGDGTPFSRSVPTQVVGIAGVTAIDTNGRTTCAIASGGAYCWGGGWDQEGMLGDGTPRHSAVMAHSLSPTRVVGLSDAIAIAVGATTVCALDASGQAWCWGDNNVDQCGDDLGGTGELAPVTVLGLPR
jgi:serine/threonine-protein kinase